MSKALVLSGGGARGAFEAGVIAGLRQRGERFDIICGTSIGAINGALCAQDDFTTLERMWRSIAARKVITYVPQVNALRDLVGRIEGLRSGPILRRLWNAAVAYFDYTVLEPPASMLKLMGAVAADPIQSVLNEVLDFTRLRDTSLIVSATNLTMCGLDVFCWFGDPSRLQSFAGKQTDVTTRAITSDNYRDAVRASAAIPGAFAPVDLVIAGQTYSYVDGGVANNTPIGQAIRCIRSRTWRRSA